MMAFYIIGGGAAVGLYLTAMFTLSFWLADKISDITNKEWLGWAAYSSLHLGVTFGMPAAIAFEVLS